MMPSADPQTTQEYQLTSEFSSSDFKESFLSPIDSLLKTLSLIVGEMDFDVYFKESNIRTQGKYQKYVFIYILTPFTMFQLFKKFLWENLKYLILTGTTQLLYILFTFSISIGKQPAYKTFTLCEIFLRFYEIIFHLKFLMP